jgi:site-specific DNA-methyltransferase (adenine-specific)
MFKYKLTWVKSKPTNFLNVKRQPLRKHEDVCIFYATQPSYNPQMSLGAPYDKGVRKDQLTGSYGDFRPAHIKSDGSRYPTDVIYFKTAEAEGRVWHPTQKPVELGSYLIKTYTNPGDIVLDNCFGSASFLVSAAREGRNCIGIEMNSSIEEFKGDPLDLIRVASLRLEGVANIQIEKSRNQKKQTATIGDFMAKYEARSIKNDTTKLSANTCRKNRAQPQLTAQKASPSQARA